MESPQEVEGPCSALAHTGSTAWSATTALPTLCVVINYWSPNSSTTTLLLGFSFIFFPLLMLHHVHLYHSDLGLNLSTVFALISLNIGDPQAFAEMQRQEKVLSLLQPLQAKVNPAFFLQVVFP